MLRPYVMDGDEVVVTAAESPSGKDDEFVVPLSLISAESPSSEPTQRIIVLRDLSLTPKDPLGPIEYDDMSWHDAGLDVYHAWRSLSEAGTLSDQAAAVVSLEDAMAQLVTWLPGWDWESGVLTDPRSE